MNLRAIIVVFALAPAAASGAGFEVPDQSPVAAATGGAATARADDAAAAFYNPSALADGAGFRGAASLALAIPRITATSLDDRFAPVDSPTSTELGVATPVALHLSYARGLWAIGSYVGVSHGTQIAWPDGWWGRFDGLLASVRVFRVAPFVAVRLGPVRLAVGVHVDIGSLEIRRALDFVDAEGEAHFKMTGTSAGADASLYLQVTRELAFGFSYQSRTPLRLRGDADFTVPDEFAGRAPDQKVAVDFPIPDRLALGVAYRRPNFGLFSDVTLSLWSVQERLLLEFEQSPAVEQPQRWHESFSVRLGGEYSPIPPLALRAGLYYDHPAAPADTLAPSSPDMGRVGITAGGSFDVHPAFGFDLSYSYVVLLGRDSESPDALPAHYSGDIHLVAIGLHARTPRSKSGRR